MGFFKWICMRIKCKSTCSYNQDLVFDSDIYNRRLCDYELKYKDLIKINTILSKRDRKPTYPIYSKNNETII